MLVTDAFYFFNKSIVAEEVHLDKLIKVGNYFLPSVYKLKSCYLPNLEQIGEYFLSYEQGVKNFILQFVIFNYENINNNKLVRVR